MKCAYTVVETLYLLVTLFVIVQGEECYTAEFSEDVWPCADFDNQHMKCEPLELGMGKNGELGLNGNLTVCYDIEEGTMMNLEIWKILDIGEEYLYHAQGDICGSLKDENAPWYPMIDAMKIQNCPIAVKTYSIEDMSISLDHVKGMITHEMCGEYKVQMCMTNEDMVKISCHELAVTLSSYQCEDKE